MSDIEKIEASEEVVMTETLLRAFAAEGCDPTVCHACRKKIKVGEIFKLVPHQAEGEGYMLDEMCCERCGCYQGVRGGVRKRWRH